MALFACSRCPPPGRQDPDFTAGFSRWRNAARRWISFFTLATPTEGEKAFASLAGPNRSPRPIGLALTRAVPKDTRPSDADPPSPRRNSNFRGAARLRGGRVREYNPSSLWIGGSLQGMVDDNFGSEGQESSAADQRANPVPADLHGD